MSWKKLVALLLVIAMFFVSCGTSKKAEPTDDSTQEDVADSSIAEGTEKTPEEDTKGTDVPASTETGANGEYFKKYDPPITISTHLVVPTTRLFQDDDTVENNGWTRFCKENYGIIWEVDWTSPDGETNAQKLDLAFASDDLPDFVQLDSGRIAKFAEAGQLRQLDDLIEGYASPLTQWALDDAAESTKGAYFLPASFEGGIYGIPVMADTTAFWQHSFIREDVLEDLGMEIPTTLEELEAVMDAYLEKYPGQYPYSLNPELSSARHVFSAFTASHKNWLLEEDGSVVYGSIQPEAKEALAKLAEWYEKGYIDPEFVVKPQDKINEEVIAGKKLTHYGHWSSIANPFTPMWTNLPDTNVTVLPFAHGKDGKAFAVEKTVFGSIRAITSKCEHPEALFYELNDVWDSYYRNYDFLRDIVKEEYDYDFKYPVTEELEAYNKEQVTEEHPGAAQPIQLWKYEYPEDVQGFGFLNDYYSHYPYLYGFAGDMVTTANNDYAQMVETIRTDDKSHLVTTGAKNRYDEWYNTHPKMLSTYADIYEYWSEFEKSDEFVADAFLGAPTETMIEQQTYLDKLELEAYTRIIMGTESLDSFDTFVENWNNNGGIEITKEVNEWYQSVN